MKTGAVIQARTSSTRLPGKVLKELPYGSGITVLQQVIRRLRKSINLHEIIIATTTDIEDGDIITIAKDEKVKWFRGSREDVLDRYYSTAKEYKLDTIVRVTSDCPCIDAAIVDFVLQEHFRAKADYSSNSSHRTFPHGLDTEVICFDALKRAHLEARQAFEREHVTPYIYKTRPDLFKRMSVEAPKDMHCPDIRITLDTEEDYALLCSVFDYLYYEDEFFNTQTIIALFQKKPWLKLINKKVLQKKVHDSLEEEIREAITLCELQDLRRAGELLKDKLHEDFHTN